MPSKRESAIQALQALVEANTAAAVHRNPDMPQDVPAGGILNLYDGDPGEPEVTLNPPTYQYEHAVELELLVLTKQVDDIDTMLAPLGPALQADATLGGICDYAEFTAPKVEPISTEGGSLHYGAAFMAMLTYTTTTPLS